MFSIGEFARLGGVSVRTLTRAQPEQELQEHKDKLPGVEARLRYIEERAPCQPTTS